MLLQPNFENIPNGYDLCDALEGGITAEWIINNLSNIIYSIDLSVQPIKHNTTRPTNENDYINEAISIILSGDLKITSKRKMLNKIARTLELGINELLTHCKESKNLEELDWRILEILDNQFTLVNLTIDHLGRDNIIYVNNNLYKYKVNKWHKVHDRLFKQTIQKILQNQYKEASKQKVDSILDLVKTELYDPEIVLNQNSESIITKNIRLAWEEGKFIEKLHDKSLYNTTCLNVDYDPYATAPRFEQFLEEIFIYDPDKESKKILILEMMGYILLKQCRFEKFFILIGEGGNGKSVLLNIIKSLLGADNISSVKLSQLGDKFLTAELYGKLANIVTEIAEGEQLPDEAIKTITSGERMIAQHKFQDPFEFEPYATPIFATNHLPYSKDHSDAIDRRAIIISFNRQFTKDEIDSTLIQKLDQEKPGIFNLMLNALEGLLRRDYFTIPPSSYELVKEWKKNDPFLQFIEQCCIIGEGKLLSKELYNQYCNWMNDNGNKNPLSHQTFTIRLKRLNVITVRGNQGRRMLQGIKLNNIY
ncbi:MAG: hypothetical protein J0H68_05715 [Sphingobacteriia bacterium]|nr:hypothetical protein [Sphingobacteriia bacterium]